MLYAVFRGRAAFRLFKYVGKMGGRNESGRFANLGYALIRADQQFLCVFASDQVMIRQRRAARMLFEGPEQIAAIDKQRVRHLL